MPRADNNLMATDVNTILKLSVPFVVNIGQRHVPFENVLALGPGAILELSKNAEDDLDLMINNKHVGRGQAVKVGENFGVRISEIGSPAARVQAMGVNDL